MGVVRSVVTVVGMRVLVTVTVTEVVTIIVIES